MVPDSAIEELRAMVNDDSVHVIHDEVLAGESVQIASGALHGLRAVVTRAMPGSERVAVLLEFLGRQTTVELSREALVRENEARTSLLSPARS